jgi:hypothetical protein
MITAHNQSGTFKHPVLCAMTRLFHFSDDGSIDVFLPCAVRFPTKRAEGMELAERSFGVGNRRVAPDDVLASAGLSSNCALANRGDPSEGSWRLLREWAGFGIALGPIVIAAL